MGRLNAGESLIKPLVFIGELLVIDAKEVEDCGIEVPYVHPVPDNVI